MNFQNTKDISSIGAICTVREYEFPWVNETPRVAVLRVSTLNTFHIRTHSTFGNNLYLAIHQIAKELADGSQVDANLLDFRKAFDKVLHACLMQRLDYYGVRGNVHNWI